MPTIEKHILINRNREYLFNLSQDYTERLKWDKYLRKAQLLDKTLPEAGGLVYCESQKGIGMTVRYLTWNKPSQTAMEMTRGPFFFERFSGSWRFVEESKDSTRVIFRYNFQIKSLMKFPLEFIIKQLLTYDLKKRLHCLKEYTEK